MVAGSAPAAPDRIIWEPYGDYLEKSNVRRFMDAHGIATYDELVERSTSDVAWFWDAALKDLGVVWDEPYGTVLDESQGLPVGALVRGRQAQHRAQLPRPPRGGPARRPRRPRVGRRGRRTAHGDLRASSTARSAGSPTPCGRPASQRGDTVGLYMPMVPELVAVFYAALKIGAVLIPVFSGFGAHALATRLEDGAGRIVFTADGSREKGQALRPQARGRPRRRGVPGHRDGGRRRPAGRRAARAVGDRLPHDPGARRLVGRLPRWPRRGVPHREPRGRGPLDHHLHLGHHRTPQGDRAHARRLPRADGQGARLRLRRQARRRLLLAHRHRLDDGPLGAHRRALLRRDRGALRRSAQLAPPGTPLGGLRRAARHPPGHLAHGHPPAHEGGSARPRPLRPLQPQVPGVDGRAVGPRLVHVVLRARRRRARPHHQHLRRHRDRGLLPHAAADQRSQADDVARADAGHGHRLRRRRGAAGARSSSAT